MSGISIDIPPNGSAAVLMYLATRMRKACAKQSLVATYPHGLEYGCGRLEIFESRNKDLRQNVELTASICFDESLYQKVSPSELGHWCCSSEMQQHRQEDRGGG